MVNTMPKPLAALRVPGRSLAVALALLLAGWVAAQADGAAISWQSENVGGAAGHHGQDRNGLSVTSAGYDIFNQGDIFQFVYTTLAGDGEITVEVSDQQNNHPWAKAGLMMRASLDPGASNAALLLTPENGVRVQVRSEPGGATTSFGGGPGEPGVWLRLARTGDTVIASRSSDGLSWTEIGRVEVALPERTYVGLAVSSHDAAVETRAVFASPSLSGTVSGGLAELVAPDFAPIPKLEFAHHFIARDVPGTPKWGFGMPVLADFDGDGDLDYALASGRADKIFWYEFRGVDEWVRHDLGDFPVSSLGGAAHDVDGDGCVDIVGAGIWYQNPCNPRNAPFTLHVYDGAIDNGHDLLLADIDNDGRADVVEMVNDRFAWYAIPADPTQRWPRTTIGIGTHGGFSPGGIGDLDGDGDNDIVRVDKWFENRDDGASWVAHDLPWGGSGPWGLSARSVIADLDGDGDNDIVLAAGDQTDQEQQEYKVGWLENGGDGSSWTRHDLPLTQHVRPLGSFHSLQVADFDGDGDLDIFSVEQEDMLERLANTSARTKDIVWVVWENLDGAAGAWHEEVIFRAKLGGHDVIAGDVDGDGDIDLVSKVWRTEVYRGDNDGKPHIDLLENRLIVAGESGAPPPGFVPLFDGTLAGWHATGGRWSAQNGELVGEQDTPGKGGFLVTDAAYGDFELLLEIHPDFGTDSGVLVRVAEPVKGYQITNDHREGGDVGGIYGQGVGGWLQQAPNYTEFWNEGAWNQLAIRVSGNPPRITSWLNGNRLADYQDSQQRLGDVGSIALQVHEGTEIWEFGLRTRYRNLYIRELP